MGFSSLGSTSEPLQDRGCTTLYLMLDFPPLEIHSFVEAGQTSQASSLDVDPSTADGNGSQMGRIAPLPRVTRPW